MWIQSLGQEDPLEEGTTTHSGTLTWRTHGQRSLVGYSHKESDMTKVTWHAHTQKNKCRALSFVTCPLGIEAPLVDMGSIKCLEEFLSALGSPTRD